MARALEPENPSPAIQFLQQGHTSKCSHSVPAMAAILTQTTTVRRIAFLSRHSGVACSPLHVSSVWHIGLADEGILFPGTLSSGLVRVERTRLAC